MVNIKDVVVIGGGPAGMMAALTAGQSVQVVLLEKNEKLGKKLYITGKGRCNVTNYSDVRGLLEHTLTNPRFMQSAYHGFTPQDLMALLEQLGVPLKTERGNRVFPISDKAQDITDALAKEMKRRKVQVRLNTTVSHIQRVEDIFHIHTQDGGVIQAHSVVVATGGLSYPSTGSTGDGYGFAKQFNHSAVDTCPALVPLVTQETWIPSLNGLSLKNVRLYAGKKFSELGEMLFTPTGISGPLVLSASAAFANTLATGQPLSVYIDLKPALALDVLDARLLRDFGENKNKHFANVLDKLLPQRLIDVVIQLSNIPADKKVHTITKKERLALANLLKALPITVVKTAGYGQAVITRGGVQVKEMNPKTMESKIVPGLFFAGEVLDVDAFTGGYNLQIAFSSGYAAGLGAGFRTELRTGQTRKDVTS